MECYFLLLVVNRLYIRQSENILASHYLHAYQMKQLVLPLLCCSVILVHACEHRSSLYLTPCIAIIRCSFSLKPSITVKAASHPSYP